MVMLAIFNVPIPAAVIHHVGDRRGAGTRSGNGDIGRRDVPRACSRHRYAGDATAGGACRFAAIVGLNVAVSINAPPVNVPKGPLI